MGEYRKEREAGPEIDAIIADLLGLCYCANDLRWYLTPAHPDYDPAFTGNSVEVGDDDVWRCTRHKRLTTSEKYSMEIAAAFQVVDAMRAKGFRWRIGAGSENPDHAFAAFWRPNGFFVQHDAEAETPALAICLAALAMLDDPDERTPEKAPLTNAATPPSPSTEEHE